MANIKIPLHELEIATARSRGPGGQHVNKTESRVILRLPLEKSKSLSSEQKDKIRTELSSRINKMDELIVTVESSRSQHRNYKDALEKIHEIINDALAPVPQRLATKIPKAQKITRLQDKKARGAVKLIRKKVAFDD